MHPVMRSALAVIAGTIALAAPASAQPRDYVDDLPPLIDRELFFGNPAIAGGQLSPDGRYVSFLQPLDGVINIWVKAIDEPFEAARPVTADTTRPVTQYFWSEDSELILYAQDKAGDENFHVYAVDPDAAPVEGSRVPPAVDLTPYESVQARIVAVPENDPAHVILAINDRDPALHDVYRVAIATGERELVRQNDEGVAGWLTDLEGNLRMAVKIDEEGNTVTYRVDPDGLEPIYTCSPLETCGPARFHADGSRAYFITNKGESDLMGFYLIDPATGALEKVEEDPEGRVDFGDAVFSEVTEELIATAYEDERTRIYPKDDGFARDLERARARFGDVDLALRSMTEDGSKMLASVSSDVEPSSTYVYDRATGEFTLLYETRPEIPGEHLAPMEAVTYTARDGVEIPAFLTVPKGVERRDLSVVILPHGGPWARDAWGYSGFAQFLANRGYAVLQPNFRGSTGYGKEFLNLGNDQWGTGTMQHDISDGVQWLIDQGIADPERVAVMGGSYGGYATLAGLAFTPELYAAGVDIVGPSNILTLLESIPPYWKPIQAIFDVRVGDLDDPADVERMKAQSPIFSAERITAPLLVIQGANDPRVKQRESDQIVVTLRDLGREVEYLVAPDEGHGFANEDNNLAMFARVEAFLAEHLGGRHQPEMEPEIRQRLDSMTVDPATVELAETAAPAGETISAFEGEEVEPATLVFTQTVEREGQTMEFEATRTVSESELEGRPVVLIVDQAATPMGSAVDSLWSDAATLVPIRRMIHQGPATVEMAFDGGSVTGRIQAGPQTMPLEASGEGTVFVSGGGLELGLGTLELEPGDVAAIRLFEALEGRIRTYRVEATGTETVETPAGSFETVVVRLEPEDGSGGQTLWIAADDDVVVKMQASLSAMAGGGTVTAVLASRTE